MYITLDNCGKNYHRSWLFRGIHLHIPIQQEDQTALRLAVLGANGAGKSTFTLMLAGQTDPTEGEISWHDGQGKALSQSRWHEFIALASPGMELPEEFTLSEWFEFHGKIKGFQPRVSMDVILDLCGFSQTTRTKQILTFSSGMKQRTKLGLAFCANTNILLLDEPLSNLDSKGYEWYRNVPRNLLENRIVIVGSNLEGDETGFCRHNIRMAVAQ